MSKTIADLQKELLAAQEELRNAPTSYSQSNPSAMLGMRAIRRRIDRLEAAIEAAKKDQKMNAATSS